MRQNSIDIKLNNILEILGVFKVRFDNVDKRFDEIDKHFDEVDKRFGDIDKRFGEMDRKFENIDQRFISIDQRLKNIDQRFESIDKEFISINARFESLEKKLEEKADAKQMDKLFEIVIGMLEQKADKSDFNDLNRKFDNMWLKQWEMDAKIQVDMDIDDSHAQKFKKLEKNVQNNSRTIMKHDVRISFLESKEKQYTKN